MKTNLKTLSLALMAAGTMVAGSAFALPSVTDKFVSGPNTWSDDSAEVLIDVDGSGDLSMGDYLVGMIKITSFPTAADPSNTNVKEFTGVFVTELIAAPIPVPGVLIPSTCGSALLTTCSGLTFGAAGAGFNAVSAMLGLGLVATDADAVVLVMESDVHNFDRETAATPALAFASAVDGATVRMELGLTGAGDFWTGIAATDFTQTSLVAGGSGVGSFLLDLTILNENFAGWDFDPNVVGSGTVQRPTAGTAFDGVGLYDDTTVSLTLSRVPEPATLGLLGLGLLGLGLSRRRKS